MDFLTRKELNGLKGEIKASEYALEAEKYTFQRELINKIGPSMIEELSKPKMLENKTVEKKTNVGLFVYLRKKGDTLMSPFFCLFSFINVMSFIQ